MIPETSKELWTWLVTPINPRYKWVIPHRSQIVNFCKFQPNRTTYLNIGKLNLANQNGWWKKSLDLRKMVNSLLFLQRLKFLPPGFQSESTSTSYLRVWYDLSDVERGQMESGRWRQSSFPNPTTSPLPLGVGKIATGILLESSFFCPKMLLFAVVLSWFRACAAVLWVWCVIFDFTCRSCWVYLLSGFTCGESDMVALWNVTK